MNKIFGYGLKDIPYISRLKNRIFYSTIIITILLNIFISLSLNLKKLADDSLFNSFFIVYLKNNLNDEQKNDLEKFSVSIEGVSSVKFVDKKESFKNLQDDLNISIPEASNPLNDSMIIYLKKLAFIEGIQEQLEARNEVKEIYKDLQFLKEEENNGIVYSIFQIAIVIISVLLAFMLLVFFNLSVGIDFLNSVNIENNFKLLLRTTKIRNLLSFTTSTFLGTLIFFNIYVYFRRYIFQVKNTYIILSLWQIFIWHLVFLAFLNFLIWILPVTLFKIDRGKNEKS